jgi:dephospho-CoA kinase
MGFPVFSWDAEIRKLFRAKAICEQVEAKFPMAIRAGQVDRKLLGAIIFPNARKRKMLEDMLYPLVLQRQEKFIDFALSKGAVMAFFEVPLLYEKNLQTLYDYVLFTYASEGVMRQRAKRRKLRLKMFRSVVKIQMSNTHKKAKADYALDTDKKPEELACVLKSIIRDIQHARTNS